MNLKLSILRRELLAVPRRKRFYLKRAMLVALGAIVLLWGMFMTRMLYTTTMGLQIFTTLSMSTLVVMCLVSAGTSSALIMREKEERTLGLLFLSDISYWDFVLGKLFTGMFSTMMAILSVLPLFMLIITLGGVSAVQVLSAFSVILSAAFLLSSLGVFCASLMKTERTMNGMLLLFSFLFFALPPIGIGLCCLANDWSPPKELFCLISPFVAMGSLIGGKMVWCGFLNCGLNVAMALPLLRLAVAALPSRVMSKEKQAISQRIKEKAKTVRSLRGWLKPAGIRGNPVAWKDLHYWHGGMRAGWLRFAISTVVIILMLVGIMIKIGQMSRKEMFDATVGVVMGICAAIVALGSLSHFGMAFQREKKSRSFEVLLTTGLTDGEIILGKISAVINSILPWIIGAVICGIIFIIRYGGERNFGEVVMFLVPEYLSMWFGYSALALLLSLLHKKNVGFSVCFGLFLLYNSLGRAMMVGVMMSSHFSEKGMVIVDILVHTALGIICLTIVGMYFRRMALKNVE